MGALESQSLIRRLILPTDELPRAVKPEEFSLKAVEDTLLYEHHTSRLNGDNARCLERFRYSNNPYGSFLPGFEDLYVGQLFNEALACDKIFPVRKVPVQALGPFLHEPLSIAAKVLRSGSRTMLWDGAAVEDVLLYGLKNTAPEQSTDSFKTFQRSVGKQTIGDPQFLLTLNVSINRRVDSPRGAIERNLRKHQSNLTYSEDGWDRWIIQQSTTLTGEHKLQETSEKSGETAFPGETLE